MMNTFFLSKTFIIILLTCVVSNADTLLEQSREAMQKKTITFSDNKTQSLQDFKVILSVLKSPRCINCHPTGDVPLQGDDQHLHRSGVVRGVDNNGGIIQKCGTCHHQENNAYARVPGAPKWHLAPRSMGWVGLTDEQIGEALMNKSKNGGRDAAALVKHMGFDSLVMWGWNPGAGRTPVPIPLDQFRIVLNDWLQTGAYTK